MFTCFQGMFRLQVMGGREILYLCSFSPWVTIPLSMNMNTWNKLPQDIQKQIDGVCGLAGSHVLGVKTLMIQPIKKASSS